MDNIKEKYLPIGTVVKLKDNDHRVMITGYCMASKDELKSDKKDSVIIWDYSACLFPEGVTSVKKNIVFNHGAIVEVYHYGLMNNETELLNNYIKKAINKKKN